MRYSSVGPEFRVAGVSLLLVLGLNSPPDAHAQTWTVGPDPVVSIGGFTEDPDHTLSEVVGGLRLVDGRVVLADRYANGLRAYSPEGVFLQGVGRSGEGPGEYDHIVGLVRCAGSPVVGVDIYGDLKLYDAQLQLLDERPAERPGIGGTPYKFGCGPSGHWAATGWGGIQEQFKAGHYVATAPVVFGIRDSVIADFGERLSSERIGTVTGDGTPAGSGPHPFGRQTSVAVGLDRLYLGDGSGFRIEVFGFGGSPLPPVEWSGPDLKVTDKHLDSYRSERLERVTDSRAPALRRWLKALPMVDQFPAYETFRVDQTGCLWVQYFQKPGESSVEWVVFDTSGTQVGGITLPETTSLLDIGADYLLVVERDELDVETVRLYPLRRRGPSFR